MSFIRGEVLGIRRKSHLRIKVINDEKSLNILTLSGMSKNAPLHPAAPTDKVTTMAGAVNAWYGLVMVTWRFILEQCTQNCQEKNSVRIISAQVMTMSWT